MLRVLLMFLPILAAFALPLEDDSHFDAEWIEWKLKHGKFYKDHKEENIRRFIWGINMQNIIKSNSEGKHSHKLSLNHFSDLTHEEFKTSMLGCVKITGERNPNATLFEKSSVLGVPDSVDWREEGCVTPVKNQGRCGSCYAFSTTGALEAQHFKRTGILVSLSEQNIVDCSKMYGNNGCQGGLMDNAFRYIKDNGGIDTEAYYPYYEQELGYCYFNEEYVGATDSGYVDIPAGDEDALKQAVAKIGPISVAIDASRSSFQSYKTGVFNDPQCKNGPYELNHGVLVVGYGTEDGQDYWLVKNSWSKYWGDGGYVKMARNADNQCGIATRSSYPIL